MGAAAWNRGSRLIRRLIDDEMTPTALILLRDLTAHSAAHNGAVAFQPTVVRIHPTKREVALMNRQEGGYAQRSYTYGSLFELARYWRLAFLEFGRDEHSRFVRVAPLPRAGAL